MLILSQCEFQSDSAIIAKLTSIRAVLLPLAGKLTSHFNSKVCSNPDDSVCLLSRSVD